MNQQAALLLEKAEEFAQSALRHLAQSDLKSANPDLTIDRKTMAAQLRIRYLFPQLSNGQIQWLLVLYWLRQSLTRLVNVPHGVVPPILRSQTEETTCQIEQCFMTLVALIKDLTSAVAMSPTQLAILDQEFFHIPFLDPIK
jgi:hypothetical protein